MANAGGSLSHLLFNRRREDDKFNVWLAYLNLENTYGESPEEAALALFQRAAQA